LVYLVRVLEPMAVGASAPVVANLAMVSVLLRPVVAAARSLGVD
jgi:hypothetical protein